MNRIMMTLIAVLSLSLVAEDSEAAQRMGGGKNLGRQREMVQPTPKTPPAQQAPAATNAAPKPQSGMSKWLGPLAGLALGAGLASLFMNNGIAGALGGILMMLLLAAAAVFVFRLLRSRHQQPAQPLQYANAAPPGAAPGPTSLSSHFGGAGAASPVMLANRYPPGFDAEQFVHHAKLNFTQLQACNDQRDLSTMRDFMTPALYADVAADLNARGAGESQKVEVVSLDAEVLEVVTEGNTYVASVRFSGTLRENAGGPAEPFSEVWHLEKPVNGRTGWLISGIQQD